LEHLQLTYFSFLIPLETRPLFFFQLFHVFPGALNASLGFSPFLVSLLDYGSCSRVFFYQKIDSFPHPKPAIYLLPHFDSGFGPGQHEVPPIF